MEYEQKKVEILGSQIDAKELESTGYESESVICEPTLSEFQDLRVGGVVLHFARAEWRNDAELELLSYENMLQMASIASNGQTKCDFDRDDNGSAWKQIECLGGGRRTYLFTAPESTPYLCIRELHAGVGTHILLVFPTGAVARIAITGIRRRPRILLALLLRVLAKLTGNPAWFRRSELRLKVEVPEELRIAIHRGYDERELQVLHAGTPSPSEPNPAASTVSIPVPVPVPDSAPKPTQDTA
jgi:hypothetical protein